QLMAYGSGTITLEQVRGLIGATEAQEVAALIDALIGGDLVGALRVVAAVAAQGADLRQFTRDLVERLRALMLLKAGGDRELIDATEDDLAALDQQAAAGELGALLNWVKLFSGLDHQLRTSAYGQLPLELAVVEAIAAPVAQSATRPAAPQQRPPNSAAPPSRPATPSQRAVSPAAPPAAPAQAATPVEEAPVEHSAAGDTASAPPLEIARPAEAQVDVSAQAPAPAASDADINERIASDNAAAAVLEQVESVWEDGLQGVQARDRTLFVLLTSSGGGKPIDLKEDMIIFEVKNDCKGKWMQQPEQRLGDEGGR